MLTTIIGLKHTQGSHIGNVFVNWLSLALFCAVWLLLIFRYVLFDQVPESEIIITGFVFLTPLLFNFFGFYNAGSLVICWIPSISILTVYILLLRQAGSVNEYYESFYIYLLGVSSTPYLTLNFKNKPLFLFGLSIPIFILVWGNSIMDLFEVGPSFKGILTYSFERNRLRAVIAYFILGGSCFTLRWFLEEGQRKNEALIIELASKNKIIEEQAKTDLQAASSRLSMASQIAGIGVWEWDIDTGDLIWDSRMRELFGVDAFVPLTNGWRRFIHPEDLEELEEKVSDSINNNTQLVTEFRIILPDGGVRHVETIGNVKEPEEKTVKMIGVCWDISFRKVSEEQLLQSESNLNATINNTTFFIWSINRHFQIIKLNKPFRSFIKEHYHIDIKEGVFIQALEHCGIEEFSSNWVKNYTRALSGESFELWEERFGRHYKHSLNPIIENAMVSGVTIFTEEKTELKVKEIALLDANKQITELRIMALRSAMNPHFIFNTLNSIQYFILRKDQISAVSYLSTFSKLIRSILNNSVLNKIKLSEEMEQIKNYVSLESMRFEDKFDFILHVEDDLDIENIEISSMLIQPYIENAILHGLNGKTTKGTLKVSIKEDNAFILFEIEDDGIGREAASVFKSQSLSRHKSLGTSLTEERLKLIADEYDMAPVIEDLYEEGQPVGTRVKVWVR